MNISSELIKIAKSLVYNGINLSEYGEFSKGSTLYFHGFDNANYLISALEKGKFGRTRLTSIGTPRSHGVPYYDRIWFKRPKQIKIYPVFYTNSNKFGIENIKEAVADTFGIDWLMARVEQGGYLSEQEWYVLGDVPLNKLDIIAIQCRRRTDDDKIAVLQQYADKMNVPLSVGALF